ncbi:hypothetical protein [Cyanobacterium aponinum]|uniref:Uncharacterized protein n=1 Tax=Cyanobacterium aponinum (strain PCC 10605) TaxID=755178 RepID=K9Z464_CYAAP|nr:hypothetical protein [Cyanobacterium aponinum]AFZ53986.1 hypothetical protein Cyan10605_1887 [Cyanobacterium aponinum PCC 10605]
MKEDPQDKLDKFQLSLYLMPLFGPIWSLVNLNYKSNLEQKEKKTARLSLKWGLIWLIVYGSLWMGGNITSDIWAVRLLYLNGVVTTIYFLMCFILISSVWTQRSKR